jgi:hypothetical protein
MTAFGAGQAGDSDSYMALADAAAELGTTPEDVLKRLLESPWGGGILVERRAITALAFFEKPSGGGGVVSK